LFFVGTPDALARTVDVTGLSSWLAVRTIDRETRRLDAIERGEPPPPVPAAIPLPGDAVPEGSDAATASAPAIQPPSGRDPRRPQQPRAGTPRPPLVPPVATLPAPGPPATAATQPQVAPLPPPIEIKPVPGTPKPRLRPPLALTPQVANPPPRPPLQNSN
jgi:large subunit ribosomal protein L24